MSRKKLLLLIAAPALIAVVDLALTVTVGHACGIASGGYSCHF
jgi:hypothetical protein